MCMRVTACMRILFSCMFFECAQRGCDGEGSPVSAVPHTKKIKLLMAWVSSNGTLSCVCVFYVCVCVHQQSCIQSISYSWLHYGIQARAFSLFSIYSSLSLSLHVGIYSLAPTVSRLQSCAHQPPAYR